MSIQSVSFGKTVTTKNGNEYKKTHAGTITGAALGAGFGSYVAYSGIKGSATMEIKRAFVPTYAKLKTIMPKEKALKMMKKAVIPGGIALGSAIAAATIFGLGALVNKAINHHRAKVADKKAAAEAQA